MSSTSSSHLPSNAHEAWSEPGRIERTPSIDTLGSTGTAVSERTVINDDAHTSASDLTAVNSRTNNNSANDINSIASLSPPEPSLDRHHSAENDNDDDGAKPPELDSTLDQPPPYRLTGPPLSPFSPRQPPDYRHEKLCQKHPGLLDHPSITFGGPMIALFDIVVPCIIYYTWYNTKHSEWTDSCSAMNYTSTTCPTAPPEFDSAILGYAVISFGMGELYILLARVYRLFFHRDECAPLMSRARWELDATSWVYGVAMICALIPFVVGSTMTLPRLYLYGPACLMSFLGLLMLCTLLPLPLPIGINSHSRINSSTGKINRVRPFIYYAAEDFIAVDGLQDRAFRVRYNARYENSPAFRRLFVLLTIWWIVGVVVYLICVSAVIWTCEFHFAFGLSLGILFAYVATWAGTSYVFVVVENRLERRRAREMGILAIGDENGDDNDDDDGGAV